MQILEKFDHDLDTPWQDLSEECRQAILFGGVRVVWRVGERPWQMGRRMGN